ncbi:nitrate reductase cytochrome c-type subunit [Endozoicomonas sp. 8E]|uniref:nitrate reductase cytochrome c-type subunit n=1 Tax=Endozoicomonas sp. 8E TaxID=3035692 RepID=UPI0029393C63|nr:nitrate reductase cytochrome c-type subunit [Endozoicomonas sp. 8E]WOG29663.1 nitrate reductase cytochrome c-type subunit [Endozoicomonas sp. 8E]
MNKLISALLALTISLPTLAERVNSNEMGGLESLRKQEVSVEPEAEYMKQDYQGPAMGRDFVDMPPLIPHSVDRYQVDKNANSCLRCHSMKNADKWGATRIAVSHYKNREGEQLADVAPNRYFCLTCHVPQKDARPLKKNTFEPVESLKKQ